MRRFDDEDLAGAEFRECDLSGARLVGVVMQNVEIDGLVTNLTVNGVEVMPYVEAELDRRHPVRLLIRSEEPGDLRKAWRQLGDDWATTIERVRSMPEGSEHDGVDGEWSMVETLRHLVFVHDSWFRSCVLGLTEPFTAMGGGPALSVIAHHRLHEWTQRQRPARRLDRCSDRASVGRAPQTVEQGLCEAVRLVDNGERIPRQMGQTECAE